MTFIHKFKDGNECHLKFGELNAPDPLAALAVWKTPPDWSKIENEYKQWREQVAEQYLNSL